MRRVIGAGIVAVIVVAILGFSWIWFAPCAVGGCAPLEDLAEYQAEGSELLDVNGERFATLATVHRKVVSLDSIPPYVPHAFVAIEDKRFYNHAGLDLKRTVGALVANVRSGEVSQGASTITQQLARNLFPDWLPYQERSLRRKVMEARVARQIERSFSKDKILELYLNHIYLGSGAYGIEAASQTYFGKPAAELTLMEAATLAGLPVAPSEINPKENIEESTRRRNLVLDQMVESGYIQPDEAAEAKDQTITLAEGDSAPDKPNGSYFVELVRRELEGAIGSGFYRSGLRIHTTLNPVAQSAAEDQLRRQLEAIESGSFGAYSHPTYEPGHRESSTTPYLQGAVVVLDAHTGAVHALVGGRDFRQSKFDRATQASRQAGSAFKPFIYAVALERFGTPAHIVEDSPIQLTMTDGQVWEPENYSGEYDGPITIREALTRSKNAATVRIAHEVGLGSVIATARSLGISSSIPELPSTALGAAGVRPIELVAAFAAFANGGKRVEPYLVEKIVGRDGRVLWEAQPEAEDVLDPAVAFVLTSMLQDVVDRGTGSAVRAVGFAGPAAGKTGTTNGATDAWFVGYTPELVAGVWIGMDDPQTIVEGASGGTLAAPVWGRMMQEIYRERPMPEEWRPPSGVVAAEVDRATGIVASDRCRPRGPTYTEYFIRSNPPQRPCSDLDRSLRFTLDDSLRIQGVRSDPEIDASNGDQLDPSAELDGSELEALQRRIDGARRERDRRLDNAAAEDRQKDAGNSAADAPENSSPSPGDRSRSSSGPSGEAEVAPSANEELENDDDERPRLRLLGIPVREARQP